MFASFLITFREGLEAALIVGIVAALLVRLGAGSYLKYVAYAVLSAAAASVVLAWLFSVAFGGFEGRVEAVFEGLLMLTAAGVLTYMVIWMHRQAKQLRSRFERRVAGAVRSRDAAGIFTLVFVSVVREGIETVLFFQALALRLEGRAVSLGGAFLGLGSAALLAGLFFLTTRNISLRPFFRITAVLLVVVAAGLAAHGVHELQEAKVLPVFKEHVFDLNPRVKLVPGDALKTRWERPGWETELLGQGVDEGQVALLAEIKRLGATETQKIKPYLPLLERGLLTSETPVKLALHERGSVGGVLKALFGYNGNPSLLELGVYILYLLGCALLLRSSLGAKGVLPAETVRAKEKGPLPA